MTARRPAHTRRDMAFAPLEYPRPLRWREAVRLLVEAIAFLLVVFVVVLALSLDGTNW